MNGSKGHFDLQASEYDQIAEKIIPRYQEMLDTLVEAVRFEKTREFTALDLGAGTGQVTWRIKRRFPGARITCLDLSPNMLEVARERLAPYKDDIDFETGDFYSYRFKGRYDLVISSLAIHHLKTGRDKKDFFQRVFESLNRGGIFFNADVVSSPSQTLYELSMEHWINHMLKTVSKEEVENKWVPGSKREDHPSPLPDQLSWLGEVGFAGVDVVWKLFGLAVYGGFKE
ncbi:MAG: class I SAM-dependent methyltransferase [bacterium]